MEDLLTSPGAFVIAKVKDLLDETGRLPPLSQVLQERRFPGSAHASYQQDIFLCQQPFLNLENIQVSSDKAIAGLCRLITRGLLPIVTGGLFCGERLRSEPLGTILV